MARLPYKMRRVTRKYVGPHAILPSGKLGASIPMEELECGHSKPDNDYIYGDQKAVAIGAIFKAIHGRLGKRRCHACAREAT